MLDIEFAGWRKTHMVAGQHQTPDFPEEEVYSGILSMDTIQIAFILANIHNLEVMATDFFAILLHQ